MGSDAGLPVLKSQFCCFLARFLSKLFKVPVPQFPRLESEGNISTHLTQPLMIHESSVQKSAWHIAGMVPTG